MASRVGILQESHALRDGTTLTDVVRERWSDIPDPRLRQVMQAVVKHVHAFVREIEPTQAEWATAIDFLTRTGKMCDDKRQEFILMSDVLGVSMLVDAINHRQTNGATPSTVEGPFHVADAPPSPTAPTWRRTRRAFPASSAAKCTDSRANRLPAPRSTCGRPMATASTRRSGRHRRPVDARALSQQADGSYLIRTVAPIAYTIPMDGPVGELMNRTNLSHMRPAHIHFALDAPGYHGLVTHLFQSGDHYIETDVVYGVKEPLIVDFKKMPAGSKAPNGEIMNEPFYVVNYDFVLEQKAQAAAAA